MNGLLKNNFYASWSNGKLFSGAMLLLGAVAVAKNNNDRGILMAYMLVSMIGFSVSAIASLRKESGTKWGKYKLTTPVKRREIVKSCFLNQLIWLLVGMLFAAVGVSLSVLLHGFPFDRNTDLLMLFVVGVSVSLMMGAAFFPLFCLWGEDRQEAILTVSFLCGGGAVMGLSSLLNWLFGPKMTTPQILLGSAMVLGAAVALFCLSYLLTVWLFGKQES